MTGSTNGAALTALQKELDGQTPVSIREAFVNDPERFGRFHVKLDDLVFDFSKHRLDAALLAKLVQLAKDSGVEAKRDAMFAGEPFNSTEGRAALHTALRNFSGQPIMADGADVMPEVTATRAKVAAFASGIRDGSIAGATGKAITDVVNIGIGGSDLGPAMAAKALTPYSSPRLRTHFVSNVDGADIGDTVKGLDPATTLFIVSSKTFTTLETMTNAQSARDWIVKGLGEDAVKHHFAAVSTKLDLVRKFGIEEDRVFGFKDWVGGRYSIWSSIGLALVIAIGPAQFEQFLRGGFEIDQHFRTAPIEANIPMLMGLIGVLYRDIQGISTQAVIPYDQRLARFPAYLQQLDMESNGKSVHRDGSPVTAETGPIVWGEPGTNGQHAFFQLIHQGTEPVPVDFLVAAEPTEADPHHHDLLLANCFAQSQALMQGRSLDEVSAQLTKGGMPADEVRRLAPHKVFSGDRPSSTFLYRKLDPRTLGRLIACYEHRVFTMAAIWDTNPFDQWGVELGKELASKLVPIVSDPRASTEGLDSSTAGLVAHRRALAR
ncbi:glucose-6-phosphate isomerase [Lichenihabitans sp. Uapishka_5]|uniref:glucose-6-phosphate isomerase n=1 Tax=Lichenihabitans sp. Uapishka_5 TaxID=3037302 RepID=UPI0029E80A9E|nr:glucose-6-phosphate isomerase [Lichenihabitans sp. Uapishka_5]MDX7953176.1 glucose-6-phosphate isomerase [Lichenihabitans sp. Uapishka_5]